jgi:predicted phage baseplate assembly protein
MALPTRNLDDRTFQDIVDEAKKRIAASCPAWSDHNVSDPGITLVELFAWMTEMILYRVNQVPEKNYIKFMELLGLRLREPEAARTQVTFYLAAPQPQSIIIPQGTEVATVRTETNPSLSFSTGENFEIHPPALGTLFTREMPTESSGKPKDRFLVLQQLGVASFSFLAFGKPVRIGNALYLGFENDVSNHVLGLEITCPTATSCGIDPANPPWKWEGWHGGEGDQRWLPVVVEEDGTGGMSYSGRILLRLPRLAQRAYADRRGYWLRCRVIESASGRNYDESPIVSNFVASSWGGSVGATNESVVRLEMLGRSDGSPGQVFHVEHTPLLRRAKGETIEVQVPGETTWEPWNEVPDFGDSGPFDKNFTCDSTTGEVRFGPAMRHPDGTSRSYGAIPPRNAQIRFSTYRYGGGVAGNVQAGTLTVLKTSIPYVDHAINHIDATGGIDPETIEMAKMRAPQLIRSRGRAVTAGDYEALARLADSRVQRARCIPPRAAGQVFLLLVPKVNRPEGRITREQLKIADDLRDSVRHYLDDYRLLTVQVDIREPQFAWVAVEISATANPDADPERVRADIESRLYRFLNPITGGPNGDGWPFGRHLYPSDVYACLQSVRGIEFIESLRLYQVKSATGDWAQGDRTEITGRLEMLEHALVASAEHRVNVKNTSGE